MVTNAGAGKYHIVGGGIAGLATAFYLVQDAAVAGPSIHIYEKLGSLGGSLDGSGDAEVGYLVRGGRMFEEHFVCTLNMLATIPSADDPTVSAAGDLFAFNEMVPGSGNCRIVRSCKPADDRFELLLTTQDIIDINRLILRSEASLGDQRIEDRFKPTFFQSNFWLMWSTMFSFQPWHSAAEMRRYLRRFIHLFPGFTRIAGILRTRYNQYDSLIVPLVTWLRERGVQISSGAEIADVTITGPPQDRWISSLTLASGESVVITPADQVYLTLGSMTEGSTVGTNDRAPERNEEVGGAWKLWRNLAAAHEGFGHPEAFSGDTSKTAWNAFTISLDGPNFFEFMEDFTDNRTGTGGLITFGSSSWILSIVLFHQPHFREQKHGTYVFWGYGLRGDRRGDFVPKPMWDATGNEILAELFGHLNLTEQQRTWFEGARVRPCRMPFITSQFMPRRAGDRPDVRPYGAQNFAVIGQYCELPRDCVFTVEYSVRSAHTAVASLNTRVEPPPPVVRTDLDPKSLFNAARVLIGF